VPRKFRVDITKAAEADVAEIWEYIAQDKPDAATAFVLRLEEQIGTLERFPERCPLAPENELLGTASRPLQDRRLPGDHLAGAAWRAAARYGDPGGVGEMNGCVAFGEIRE
jgi:plasmid stabilization system protein ParE